MHSPAKIKVAILGPLPPVIGGVVTTIQSLLHSPLQHKYTFIPVQTMSRKHGDPAYVQEHAMVKMIRIARDNLKFIWIMLVKRPVIVHINSSLEHGAFERDALSLIIAKVFRRKVLMHYHGGNLEKLMESSSARWQRFIVTFLNLVDVIAVLSEKQKRPFIERGFQKRIRIFPNMMDVSTFERLFKTADPWPVPEDRIVVTMIASRFYLQKGVFELMRAAERIIRTSPKAFYVFVGSGEEEKALRGMAEQFNIQNSVLFTGFLNREEILRILKASDIFTLPSYSEGFPMVLLEAMAAGLPVICTPVGAVTEMIDEDRGGYLVPVGDDAALTKSIHRLVQDASLRKRFGQANVQRVRDFYTSEAVAPLFDDCYTSLINGRYVNAD